MRGSNIWKQAFCVAALACAASCGGSYEPDGSFEWGTVGIQGAQAVQGLGWIGGGIDGWRSEWGTYSGSGSGCFWDPGSVAVDRAGYVYVADKNNHRICRWTIDGMFKGWIGGGYDGWQTGSAPSASNAVNAFSGPSGVCVDDSGRILVADTGNSRICRWGADGAAEGWIGGGSDVWETTPGPGNPGAGCRQFSGPEGVFVDPWGDIIVADTGNHRICRWDAYGNSQGWIGYGYGSWQVSTPIVSSSGMYGYFASPAGVCTNQDGTIYVADTSNHRVARWTSGGSPDGWIGDGSDGWSFYDGPAHVGNDMRSFDSPSGVAVDYEYNIWVADTGNHRISKRQNEGKAVGWFGAGIAGFQTVSGAAVSDHPHSFNSPAAVALGGNGILYVADTGNARVCAWRSMKPLIEDQWPPAAVTNLNAQPGAAHGSIELSWTAPGNDDWSGQATAYMLKMDDNHFDEYNYAVASDYPQSWKPKWAGNQEVVTIYGLTLNTTYHFALRTLDNGPNVSAVSNIVSAMPADRGITSGLAQGWIGDGRRGWNTVSGANPGTSSFDSFYSPAGVSVDSQGYIYVAEGNNHRVSRWDAQGNPRGWIGGGCSGWQTTSGCNSGYDYDEFYYPADLFVDEATGFIYVAEAYNHRISRWTLSGYADGYIGCGYSGWTYGNDSYSGAGQYDFNYPRGIWATSTHIYVADSSNSRICRWTKDGGTADWLGGGSIGWKTGSAPSAGATTAEFNFPTDVCTDSLTNIYVADQQNHRISVWNGTSAAVLGWLGGGVDGLNTGTAPDGSPDPRSFYYPMSVCWSGNTLFVSDNCNHRICKWGTVTFGFIGWIGGGADGWQTGSAGSGGSGFMSFFYPNNVWVANGVIYVADENNYRIARWID